jgi:hypothetical protein
MKYFLFHTSLCGSTLLACHLSKSIPTLSEPDWGREALEIDDLWEKVDFVKKHHPNNHLVKYTSYLVDVMPHIKEENQKKVFLYRDFEDHHKKLMEKNNHLLEYGDEMYELLKWSQRFSWAIISNNTLYVNSKAFLEDPKKYAELICNSFEIEYKPVDIDFHVKRAGYLHSNTPIKIGY